MIFLIKITKNFLHWLESLHRKMRKRRGEICACGHPTLAFGHREYCFGCKKNTGF